MSGRIGFAVDLGTTTIDACLIDSGNGSVLANTSRKNRQARYGSDVINRILTVTRDASFLRVLRELVCEDIRDMLCDMLEQCGLKADKVDMICVCGNTTMISILLAYDIEPLGRYPFTTRLKKSVLCDSESFFSLEGLSCPVLLSGCASAFIGGDILAGMVFLNRRFAFGESGTQLLLDLGTNGEMILYRAGSYYGASTACGPAFEGCVRRQNAYGSNVIDAVSLGVKAGKIGRDGVIREPFFEKGLDIQGVHLDMNIMQQLMLAKAAIRAGIDCLADTAQITVPDIDTVYLAGGFGFYLNPENAIAIGLLPDCFRGRIRVCGNTSLSGAGEMLCHTEARAAMDSLTDGAIQVVQLAASDGYHARLLEHMHV